MANEPVNAWDQRVLVGAESTYLTSPAPAASQAMEVITLDTGPSGELGVMRPKRDRHPGRGMQNDWVEGRVAPIPWSLEKSVMDRADADDAPVESALYRAGGLVQTINSSTSVVYTPAANPLVTANSFQGATIRATKGLSSRGDAYLGEEIYGCVVQQLAFSGGDKEITLRASGVAAGKRHSGRIDSITLANDSVTALTTTAAESYMLSTGVYMLCESEAILIATANAGSTSHTITRAQASTSGAAHTAQPLVPYVPDITASSRRPIPETTCTVTLDSIATRCTAWAVNVSTGMGLLPGETGSKRAQGVKATRVDSNFSLTLAMKREDVAWLGKASARKLVALSIVQGTGAGKVFTYASSYCELNAVKVPDTANDIAMVTITGRVRDSSGDDSFQLTLT